MRYVTAMIGAVVVFFSALVIAFVIFAMLPPKLQSDDWTFRTGIFQVRGNPVLVFAPILGLAAAFYSFRDSLKRHRLKAEKKIACHSGRSAAIERNHCLKLQQPRPSLEALDVPPMRPNSPTHSTN
jgi:hypothetical protein